MKVAIQASPSRRTRRFVRTVISLAALALGAAAFSPLHAETYQFIISGDPVAAATVDSCAVASAATSLETATRSEKSAASSLEARCRTWLESLGRALRSDRFRGLIMHIR